jgi:hypothetical protein
LRLLLFGWNVLFMMYASPAERFQNLKYYRY